eukprot:Sspe_Gene.114260::Locus_99752_Transcript_2_2_Confidence_0.667_Length_648::g.114260::m.114260
MGSPGMQMPKLTQREEEILMAGQMFDQMHAINHALYRGLDLCFVKCMDTKDIATAYRREWKEHHRVKDEEREKECMKTCHQKFQKAYSIAMQQFRSSNLQKELLDHLAKSGMGPQPGMM